MWLEGCANYWLGIASESARALNETRGLFHLLNDVVTLVVITVNLQSLAKGSFIIYVTPRGHSGPVKQGFRVEGSCRPFVGHESLCLKAGGSPLPLPLPRSLDTGINEHLIRAHLELHHPLVINHSQTFDRPPEQPQLNPKPVAVSLSIVYNIVAWFIAIYNVWFHFR